MTGHTYEAGVLIAAEQNERFVWALHRRPLEQGNSPSVPATVLAQAWRGGPQAKLSRFLAGCEVRPLTAAQARECGRLRAGASSSDIVDANVVIVARERAEVVLTSDQGDLTPPGPAVRGDLRVAGSSIDCAGMRSVKLRTRRSSSCTQSPAERLSARASSASRRRAATVNHHKRFVLEAF